MSSAPTPVLSPSTRFPNLSVPAICTTDIAQIANQNILEYQQDFQLITNIAKTLAPGDPVRILLLRMAARESQLRSIINYGFQQNFIISAVGNNLDAIGANYGIGPGTPGASSGLNGQRLPASFAITTLQFSLASSISTDTNIPVGTGVATSGGIIFATLADATITAGTTSVSVAAQCLQSGIIGNGYTAGQVSSPQSSIAGVTTSVNTTTTQGGADAEGDDQYAQRLALLPGAFSVAGPIGAYKYWA